ncbi:MAG: hypothetical protein FJ088_03880 [Deltaproteobacteria bacterium]|nr:hypothetical protein [Deltaproteobacteria bacterium]
MRRITIVFFAALTFQLVSISCIEERNPQVLLYVTNLAMTRETQCIIQVGAGANQLMRTFSILDFALGNRYFAFPLIRNQLPSIFTVNESSVSENVNETNYVQIIGAYVEYDLGELAGQMTSDVIANAFTDPTFVFSNSGLLIAPGIEGVIGLEIVPNKQAGHIREALAKLAKTKAAIQGTSAEIVAYVTLEGMLQDGTVVKSNLFYFPLKLCFGCLIAKTVSNCNDLPEGVQPPCIPGQDDTVDCRLCCFMGGDPDLCYCNE